MLYFCDEVIHQLHSKKTGWQAGGKGRMPKTARRTTPLRVHPEDIKAMIRKTGVGVTELSVSLGYAANAISTALKRPWPAVEADLAAHFGVKPQSLFPERYDAEGHPLSFPASKRSRAKTHRLRQKSLSA